MQIDVDGNEVPVAAGGTPVSAGVDGKATCPATTSIAMAGALDRPERRARHQHPLRRQGRPRRAQQGQRRTARSRSSSSTPRATRRRRPRSRRRSSATPSIIGLLGPAFSGETKATGPIFYQADLLSLTASATNPALTTNGWTNFFRGLANDGVQGPAVANYLTKTLGYKKICVIEDNSYYGVGLAQEVTTGLGAAADSNCAGNVKVGDKDFSATVQLVKGAAPDAVFYAGYYAEAAPFVQQLRDAGVTATFVSADGTNDPQFVDQAGEASKDAILSCPCGPAPDAFATAYNGLSNKVRPPASTRSRVTT